jgi:hypothetical protein
MRDRCGLAVGSGLRRRRRQSVKSVGCTRRARQINIFVYDVNSAAPDVGE